MRMNWCAIGVFAVAGLLGGCNSYNLRYEAQPQPSNAHLYADYTLLQDSVAFSIDTDGQRLEDVFLVKPDGNTVRAVNIGYPSFGKNASVGTGVGVGGWPVGGGVGFGVPVGPEKAHGVTTATFLSTAAGPSPWTLHVKVQGVNEAVIPGIGGKPTAK